MSAQRQMFVSVFFVSLLLFNNPQACSLVLCKPLFTFVHLQLISKHYSSNCTTAEKLCLPELDKILCVMLAQCQHIEYLTSVENGM